MVAVVGSRLHLLSSDGSEPVHVHVGRDDATFDDAIERLVFLAKIEAGLTERDEGKGVSHDEARRRLGV